MLKTMVSSFRILVIVVWGTGLFIQDIHARDGIAETGRKITLQLRWFHQFQFAGYYAAKENGFYRNRGLDVDIKEGELPIDTISRVMSGQAQFGVTNAEILISRLRDRKKVVVIAPIFQHSPLAFIARRDVRITHPQDFIGKRVKMSRDIRDLELHAMLFSEGVAFDQFEVVEGPGDQFYLFDPAIDVMAVYLTNEPYYYIEKGVPYNLIRPSSYGIDFYGDSIFAAEDWAKKHPDIVAAFKAASIRGWQYAMANKEEMIELIRKKYNPSKTREHLAYEADAMDKLILQDLVEIGHTNPGRWASIAKVFADHGVIRKDYSLEGFIFSANDKKGFAIYWTSITLLSGGIFLTSLISIILFKFNNRLNREVKEKKESQKALQQSEARLKAMFENIHSGVGIYQAADGGSDFIIKGFNKAAQQIDNIFKDRVVGKRVTQVFPAINEFGLLDVLSRVYHTGNPEHMPVSRYRNNRIVGWRENYVYQLPSGEIAVVFNDETVRKKAEIHRKHLDTINHIIINTRHSQKMLNDLLDAMLDIFESDRVWLLYPCDPDAGSYTLRVERIRSRRQMIASSTCKISNDKDMARSMKEVLDVNRPVTYDRRSLSAQKGDTLGMLDVKYELRMAIYPKLEKAWMLGMHRCESDNSWTGDEKLLFNMIGRRISDGLNAILLIEELKKANKVLAESEDRFSKIFHASPVGILIAEKTRLRILNTNPSLCNITGFRKESMIGKSLLDDVLFIVSENKSVLSAIRDSASFNNRDVRFVTADKGVRNGRLSSQSVTIADRQSIIITLEDVTEYKKAEKEKLKAHKHVAEQEKYALIGQVAGKMAHDFNNILGAIMGNTELSLLDCNEPDTRKTLELILEQTKRGRNLTKNLVVFAKDQEPRQDFFSINEKVTLVLNLLKKDLEGISISTSLFEPMPELLADPGMIENALVNVVQNAIHAVSKTEYPKLELLTHTRKDRILVEIFDNGCGIPKVHEKSIYAPAFTLKNSKDTNGAYDQSVKGTGYGLFNVKKIVEKHKGRIWFETVEKKGTRFFLSFPVTKKDLTLEEKKEFIRSVHHTAKKILIVEDEQSIAQVQFYMLTHDPFFHFVDIAHNGHMALDLLAQNTYDLISLDYRLPGGLNGMDLYKTIRKDNTAVPILFISGNVEFLESLSDLMENDPYLDYLSKPCQNRVYAESINTMLDKNPCRISA